MRRRAVEHVRLAAEQKLDEHGPFGYLRRIGKKDLVHDHLQIAQARPICLKRHVLAEDETRFVPETRPRSRAGVGRRYIIWRSIASRSDSAVIDGTERGQAIVEGGGYKASA